MKRPSIFLGLILFGFVLPSCAASGPSTLEVLNSLEASVNEKDLDGVMALFAEDAVAEFTYAAYSDYAGTDELEILWSGYLKSPVISEFKEINIEGDNATFDWVEVGAVLTHIYPTRVEIRDGKITHMDFYEEPARVRPGDE